MTAPLTERPGAPNADPGPLPHVLQPCWRAPANVRACFTLRSPGASHGPWGDAAGGPGFNLGAACGDDASAVARNRATLQALAGVPLQWLEQVHGDRVVRAPIAGTPRADAVIAADADVGLVIQVADCLPVLFCADDGSVIGAAHAGWRGLAAGVLERTVDALAKAGASPGRLRAWLGPAIGPSAFEVGPDVLAAFVDPDPGSAAAFVPWPGRPGKWACDLGWLARRRLAACGVIHVWHDAICTVSAPLDCFSFRRDGVTGRMAAIVWREGLRSVTVPP